MASLTRLSDDLAFARSIIDRVDSLTLERFTAGDLAVETKADDTPVTDADREAERVIRAMLGRSRSRDAVYGEEEGGVTVRAARRWIIDPIDGTKNYMRGVPVWATLLALEEEGEIVLGIVSAPSLGRRWWGAKGLGAFTGRSWVGARRIRVSEVADLADASISYSSLSGGAARGPVRAVRELHARGRGGRGRRGRARTPALRHGCARADRRGGGRLVHFASRRAGPVGWLRSGDERAPARGRPGGARLRPGRVNRRLGRIRAGKTA